jgi:Transglutaminase-like superfamily
MSAPADPAPTAAETGISPLTRLGLLARVWITAARVQIALRRWALPELVDRFAVPSQRDRVSPSLLSAAVSRGLRIGRWHPRCLTRSLVLYLMLREQGDPAELIIGLRDQSTTHGAHAWIELRGRDIGPLPGGRGYQEMSRYPRGSRTSTESPDAA